MDESTTNEQKPEQQEYDVKTSAYANNVHYQPNVWDVRLIFGELRRGQPNVDWHTAVTLPWAQAKLMSYYLRVNLALYEAANGEIHLPESVRPPDPDEFLTEERLESDPSAREARDLIRKEWNELLGHKAE